MSFKNKLFCNRNQRLFTASLVIAASAASFGWWHSMSGKTQPPPASGPAAQAAKRPPVDLASLAERFGAPPPLTEEQIAEDARMEEEQVELARQWLQDPDVEQRITGAEQLSAYPTTQAEQALVTALKEDTAPEVRSAAAASLSAIRSPKNDSVESLIAALADRSEDVRFSALSTLQAYMAREAFDSARSKLIMRGLKRTVLSKSVPSEDRQAIKEFLKDQAATR